MICHRSLLAYLIASSQSRTRLSMTMTRTRSAAKKRDATADVAAVNKDVPLPAKKTRANKKEKGKDDSADPSSVPWYFVFTKGDEEYNQYMATEWSFEKRGDQALFEKICLEGAQSGMSWQTILRKREAYRRTFFNFDPHKVAQMSTADVQDIIDAKGNAPRDTVVRHRGKIEATIHNARCLLAMQEESGDSEMTLDRFLWSFVDDKPILNRWGSNFDPYDYASLNQCPSQTPESQAMSKALKERGWKFVGPVTCYALMQSTGMVIDHPISSPEWEQARQRLLSRPGGFQDRTGGTK